MKYLLISASFLSLELDVRCHRRQTKLPAYARHAALVDDVEHIDPRNRLRRHVWQLYPQVAGGTPRGLECQAHVPITGGQAVRVVVAAKDGHRPHLGRASCDPEIEVPSVRRRRRRIDDDRPGRPTAAPVEEIRRGGEMSDTEAPGRIATPPQA